MNFEIVFLSFLSIVTALVLRYVEGTFIHHIMFVIIMIGIAFLGITGFHEFGCG